MAHATALFQGDQADRVVLFQCLVGQCGQVQACRVALELLEPPGVRSEQFLRDVAPVVGCDMPLGIHIPPDQLIRGR